MLQVVRSHKSMVAKAAATSAKKTDERGTDKAGEGAPKYATKAGSGEKKRKSSREEQPAEKIKPAKPAVSKPQKKQKTPVGAARLDGFQPRSVHSICTYPCSQTLGWLQDLCHGLTPRNTAIKHSSVCSCPEAKTTSLGMLKKLEKMKSICGMAGIKCACNQADVRMKAQHMYASSWSIAEKSMVLYIGSLRTCTRRTRAMRTECRPCGRCWTSTG